MPLFGPPNIEKLKGKRDVESLIKALGHKDVRTREVAAQALGEIRDVRAIGPLISQFQDEDVRKTAESALVKIGTPAVESLIAVLKHQDEDVRKTAASALAKVGDPAATEPLVGILGDNSGDVRLRAVRALRKLGWKPRNDTEKALYLIANPEKLGEDELLQELSHLGEPATEPLLGDSWPRVRMWAAGALGRTGDPRAVVPLAAALADSDSYVRIWAADALGRIGDPRAVVPLAAALGDSDSYVRKKAAEALGEIGDRFPREVSALAFEALTAAVGAEPLLDRKVAAAYLSDPVLAVRISAAHDASRAAWDAIQKIGRRLGELQQPAESEGATTVTDVRNWRCPNCGEVLGKGGLGVVIFPGEDSSKIAGTGTCTRCDTGFPQSEIYGGKFDFVGERAPKTLRPPEVPASLTVLVVRQGEEPPEKPDRYCEQILQKRYGDPCPAVQVWKMLGSLERPSAEQAGVLYARLRETGQMPDFGSPADEFEGTGPDGASVAALFFWKWET